LQTWEAVFPSHTNNERLSDPASPQVRPSRRRRMTILQKLFSRKTQPTQRVRICVECGMPVAEHKEWCSILRTQKEMAQKGAAASPSS
jgi:hypothetical protein